MKQNSKNIPIKDRLKDVGVTVTDKMFGGWNKGIRMLVDKDGKELGFFSPLEAVNEFCK